MENKYRKFYVDWWKIRRSTLYGLALLIVLSAGSYFGVRYAMQSDWFSPADIGSIPKDAARIISFEGDVRITRAATRETIVITRETYAAAGDTIQTQSDGRATVQMTDGSVFSVRPNSTVVIRDNSSLFGGRNVRVSLDDGQMNVRTDDQPENSENVVEMMDSETRLRSQTDASFSADQRSNGGEIRISRGSVDTTIGSQTTTLSENEYAAIGQGKITSREKLLGAPSPRTPANAAQVLDNLGSGVSVAFSWDAEGIGIVSYHIQVARSPYFSPDSMLVDRGQVTAREFRLSGLTPGTYYWRIKSMARSGQTSDWSEPPKFNVVRGSASPTIEVTGWGVEPVGGTVYIVSGRTAPGLLVRTQGREVYAGADGTFRIQVSSPTNQISLEMGDDRGNRAGFVLSLRTAQVLRRF